MRRKLGSKRPFLLANVFWFQSKVIALTACCFASGRQLALPDFAMLPPVSLGSVTILAKTKLSW
jgi:hypothetical protein